MPKSSSPQSATGWAKRLLKWLLIFILIFVVYVVGSILHGTFTEFQPTERIALKVEGGSSLAVVDTEELSFVNWNIGYAGLGQESNFFYDDNRFFFSGGKMVRPTEALSKKNLQGILDFLKANPTDFILLQEVDSASTRSYFVNQYDILGDLNVQYSRSFATNFKVSRVPLPLCEPWHVMGQMHSGLASYSRYQPSQADRLQFPGEFPWPSRIFNLDRCMLIQRYKTVHPQGKELIVINTHNSAYDDGSLKAQEMAYFKKVAEEEYAKGNYVIVGGDWNQCPPNFYYTQLMPNNPDSAGYKTFSIAPDFMAKDWQWVYDPKVATNRKLVDTFVVDKTFTTLIDFYLVSPNVEVLEVRTQDLKFAYSDHQPVFARFRLKGLKPQIELGDSLSVNSQGVKK